MSFRNYSNVDHENIKIEEQGASQLFLSSKFPAGSSACGSEQEIITKIADIIVNLHETFLLKCQHFQIYRDLSQQEQALLLMADKNTPLHTALAGALAIDSCLKSLEREEQFVLGNLLRANAALISHYKALEQELMPKKIAKTALENINDSIKLVTQQLQALPASKSREHELEKQMSILENGEEGEWLKGEQASLMSDLQKENELLRMGIREKEGHIKNLESRLERGASKIQKPSQLKTAHSLRMRLQTQKSSENESSSQASLQHAHEQLCRLREELQQKNKIIYKMNEQFASEMQKYNSVFRRLEEENRILKKYNDTDTAYLLQQLQIEIEMLRDQKRKDQLIISDIQRKIEGISFSRNSRINTHQHLPHYPSPPPPNYDQFDTSYPQQYGNQYFERNQNSRGVNKYYSPNYTTSRASPYQRTQPFREDNYFPAETYRSRASRREEGKNKSRGRYQGLQESRQSREPMEPKSSPTINLLERVMSKRI